VREINLVQEAEIVSDLVGDIYDASLDPALWPEVLESVQELIFLR
jgi:hypothetical protein